MSPDLIMNGIGFIGSILIKHNGNLGLLTFPIIPKVIFPLIKNIKVYNDTSAIVTYVIIVIIVSYFSTNKILIIVPYYVICEHSLIFRELDQIRDSQQSRKAHNTCYHK